MSSTTIDKHLDTGKLSGVVDAIAWPRTVTGWLAALAGPAILEPCLITVRDRGRLIGQGRSTTPRPDVRGAVGSAVGFEVICTEDIDVEALALGRLAVEAVDAVGRTCKVEVADMVRDPSFTRLLLTAPSVGPGSASTIVGWLAQNENLAAETRQALAALRGSLSPAIPKAPPTRIESDAPVSTSEEMRQFWFRFESLGRDCTLGAVQRHFGVEPLGLLRFTAIGIDAAITAIREGFSGVGDPEFTRLTPDHRQEYKSSDTRYHMDAHTFIFEGQADYDTIFRKQCRKLSYLARNLLEDLQEGRKIFVVHNLPDELDPDQIIQLHKAIRDHGPGWLLYLSGGTTAHPVGTAYRVDDGLIFGHANWGDAIPIADRGEVWLSVCRRGAAVVDAERDR